MGERRRPGRYPGETEAEFRERVLREDRIRRAEAPKPARERRDGETDQEWAKRIVSTEQARTRQERRRRRQRGADSVRPSRPEPQTTRDTLPSRRDSSRVTGESESRDPSRVTPAHGRPALRLVHGELPEGNLPTLYGVSVDNAAVTPGSGSVTVTRDSRDFFVEGGVGGEGTAGQGLVKPIPPCPAVPEVTRDTERDRTSERDRTHVGHSVQNGFGATGFADVFGGADSGGAPRDRDSRDGVTVTRDRDQSRFELNGQRERDQRGERGAGEMSEMDIREEFREINAALSRMGRTLAVAREQADSANKNAAVAVARLHGVELLRRRYGQALGVLEPTLQQIRGMETLPEAERTAADQALKAYQAMIEPRLQDGKLVPIEADAVITAGATVNEANAALYEALTDDNREVELPLALASGFRLLMFHANVSRIDEAQRVLSEQDVLCLEEVHRSAVALGRGDEDSESKAFALYMLWVDKFARDAVVSRQKKTPCDLVLRVSHYLTAVLPEPRLQWTRQKAVREWRKISGE